MEMTFDIILKYNSYANLLKTIVRTGWIRSQVDNGESIAEHLFHSAVNIILLRKILTDIKVDWEKALLLAMLHDLAEVEIGDIPKHEKTIEDKEKEIKILSRMFKDLAIEEKWVHELSELKSIEALIVKYADLTSTIFQGISYLDSGICNDYLKNIILNSCEELDYISKLIKSRDATILTNFIIGYVRAIIKKSCAN